MKHWNSCVSLVWWERMMPAGLSTPALRGVRRSVALSGLRGKRCSSNQKPIQPRRASCTVTTWGTWCLRNADIPELEGS
jgi:hypothetical protein